MSETSEGRTRDLDRLLTFVDAIVAIAITLLVLPLVEITADLEREMRIGEILGDHANDLWSFFLSFFVIAQLWFAQHRAVAHLLRENPRMSRLLVLWTLTIVFLPFPTALVAQLEDQAWIKVLYVGTIALSSLLIALIDATIARHPELTDGLPPSPVAAVTTVVLMLVALGVMLAFPDLSYYPLLLLFLSGPVQRVFRATFTGNG